MIRRSHTKIHHRIFKTFQIHLNLFMFISYPSHQARGSTSTERKKIRFIVIPTNFLHSLSNPLFQFIFLHG